MCTNYKPASREIIARIFALDDVDALPDYPDEAWPGYLAPFVDRSELGRFRARAGSFGLVPFWARDAKIARHTYNARSETVAEKPAFRQAWQRGQRCLVPMLRFFEPDWTTGKAVRWRIERADGEPFAIAAIHDRWVDRASGLASSSFSLLTINADGHPVMGRFHREGDEKRSLVPIAPADWSAWLDDEPEGAARLLRPMAAGDFTAAPDPRPPAARRRVAPADD
ncbi:MAG: SOS response-associated peptidase [Lautropia sp.]